MNGRGYFTRINDCEALPLEDFPLFLPTGTVNSLPVFLVVSNSSTALSVNTYILEPMTQRQSRHDMAGLVVSDGF